jgi:hypothetical protein
MSTSKELEELQNRKARLEEESNGLKTEQGNLEERVKVLGEKIAIEELKSNNKATSEAISKLESKIDELEQRLRQVSQTPGTPHPINETVPKIMEPPEPAEQNAPEPPIETTTEEPAEEEDVVTVTTLEDSAMVQQEEFSEDVKRRNDKKKRKFF